ncbi:MAG TPA: cytochrome c biogenesis protein CcdA [Polyangia bacterium]|nr:cytochrome c biogenesis protein CcdA [Polyangia bacterium]
MGSGPHPSLLFALTYGFLTALTPCVYPMIPITVSIFGARAGVPRSRALLLATAYVLGIATMFGALGTTFGLVGRAFGTFLANPWVIVPLALFFVAMGLSMFGAFEVALPSELQARLSRIGGRGMLGAFLMGLVAGIIAAPCTGPPLASLLAYVATTRNAGWGFVLLATYGVGVGLPFWLLAGFSMSLPRPGVWMEWIKSVFGVALFAAALYYLKNVVPALARFGSGKATFALEMAALVVAGVLLGAVHASFHGGAGERVRKALGVALATVGLFGATNYLLAPKGNVALHWMTDEPAALADVQATGRPLLIDFSATWCLPCREFDVKVFSRPDVAQAMGRFTLLRLDVSQADDVPALGALKRKYGADTLPAIRLVSPAGAIVAKTDSFLPPERFLELLAAVPR